MKYSIVPIVFNRDKRSKANTQVLIELEKQGSEFAQIEKDVTELTAEIKKVYVSDDITFECTIVN